MAYTDFQQSDDSGSPPLALAVHCSSDSLGSGGRAKKIGGTAGTTTYRFSIPTGGTSLIYINWENSPPADHEPSLLAGDWTVDLHVTSGASMVRLGGLWICHESSAGNETIATYSVSPGEQMTTGVHTITFNSKAPTWWWPGDSLYYVVSFLNNGFFAINLQMQFDKLCVYPKAVDSWRGVTRGGGYLDRKREAVI